MMRVLTIVVILAGLLWSAWWLVGSVALDRGLRAGLAEARARGWEVTLDDLSVSGFPNRFDTRLTSLAASTPDRVWGIALPFAQVFALSYRPNKIILVPASEAQLQTPVGPIEITSEDLRASATLSVSSQPNVMQATVVGDTIRAVGVGRELSLETGQWAMRKGAVANSYDVALSLSALDLGAPLPDLPLPPLIDTLEADVTAVLDRPLPEDGRLTELTIRYASIIWDGLRMDVGGALSVRSDGALEGDILLELTDWRRLLPVLTDLGLQPGQAALLAGGLSGLEVEGVARVPLTLRGGQLLFGTIPLAQLPPLPAPYNP